jgi:nucleoside-diphosphate-sugar epimerase
MTENLILCAHSMVGRALTKILPNVYKITHDSHNLLSLDECRDAFYSAGVNESTVIYNLSGYNGSIIYNLKYPYDIFYQSTQMNLNILECCRLFKPKKVINIISACSYPDTPFAMKEEDLFNGLPNQTVECHGFAKRILLEMSRQAYKQYELKSICTILTNLFGDGDRFNLERTKVVGAVIRKIWEAERDNEPSITFRGTGSPVRELMYAGDAAHCLVQIANSYDDYLNPINIGSDQTISILEIVNTVADLIGYRGNIIWNTNESDGQAYRKLDTSKMKRYVNHKMTPFIDGLKKTIEYYEEKGRFLDR